MKKLVAPLALGLAFAFATPALAEEPAGDKPAEEKKEKAPKKKGKKGKKAEGEGEKKAPEGEKKAE